MLIEGLRAVLRAPLGEGVPQFTEPTGIGEDVAHEGRHEQHLGGRDAATTVGPRQQALGDHSPQELGELESRRVLAVGREVGQQ